ncbi:type II toxin-antitoxin system CcdA family antitoxin [Sagittula sp. S175]|uniref:type II toxin-antitoxin system CcdA family antitoxin n=1 Tax=Sagittula sp. S175 TaxID=3415129 RepID=UPI003C7B0AAE
MHQVEEATQRTDSPLTTAEAFRLARTEAWAQENAAAIAERRAWIEANGTPLADLQVLS